MNDKPSVSFTQNYIIYRPLEQGVYPIRESEWRRLKSLISAIVPQSRVYQNLSSISFGVFISSAFQVMTISSPPPSNWILPTTWSIFAVSLLVSIFLLLLDREHRGFIQTSTKGVISEMELLEKDFEKTSIAQAEFMDNSITQEHQRSEDPQPALSFSETKSFAVNDTVYHQQFGIGKVLEVKPRDEDTVLVVRFQDIGVKMLSVKFANLKKVTILTQ